MAKNLVREVFDIDGSWTCPGGVTRVRVYAMAKLFNSQVVAINGRSTLALDINGLMYSWGDNTDGAALGEPVGAIARSSPVVVIGSPLMMLGPEAYINAEGDAYGWGSNIKGNVGDGSVTTRSAPVIVVGGLKWRQICGTIDSRFGLTVAGAAYAWGGNVNGTLGDGTVTSRSSPVAVLGGFTWKTLALNNICGTATNSSRHMTGVTTTGITKAWGMNDSGQLGVGDVTPRSSPVTVLGGLTFKELAVGFSHSLGITTAGDMYAWGINTKGELGLGDTTPRSSPVIVLGGRKWKSCAAMGEGSMGITTDGDLYAWGNNGNGQLGDGTVVAKSSPVAVLGGFKWVAVSSSGTSANFAVGLRTNGTLYAWGINTFGGLGVGDVTPRSSPVAVLGGFTFRSLQETDAATRVITVVPGTSYTIALFASVIMFGNEPIYADSDASGATPINMVLEYEA